MNPLKKRAYDMSCQLEIRDLADKANEIVDYINNTKECEHLFDSEEYMPTCHNCKKLMRNDSPLKRTANSFLDIDKAKALELINCVIEILGKKKEDPELMYACGMLTGFGKTLEQGIIVDKKDGEKIIVV